MYLFLGPSLLPPSPCHPTFLLKPANRKGLWGILKRAIPVKRVRMMKRIREVQWQQWKHLIKDYPLKPFEVMLRSFARSRLLKEEAESMKDEEERRDIKEKADEEKKKKEEEDKREKEALQTIANNMRDKNQKSEKRTPS